MRSLALSASLSRRCLYALKLPITGTPLAFDALACPNCGGSYLHHDGISYFNRDEDREFGEFISIKTTVKDDRVVFSCSQESNYPMDCCPSPRRDGMEISFYCENCSAKLSLAVFQHKGQTFIEWRKITDENDKHLCDFDSIRLSDWTQTSGISRSTAYELLKLLNIKPEARRVSTSRKPVSYLNIAQMQKLAPWVDEIKSGTSIVQIREHFWRTQEKPQRKTISPGLRFQVMKRDNYRCQMCGVSAKDGAMLEIDHIVPVSKGGHNSFENLQVLCSECNSGKSNNFQ